MTMTIDTIPSVPLEVFRVHGTVLARQCNGEDTRVSAFTQGERYAKQIGWHFVSGSFRTGVRFISKEIKWMLEYEAFVLGDRVQRLSDGKVFEVVPVRSYNGTVVGQRLVETEAK